jgi:chromosome segregation ATPase
MSFGEEQIKRIQEKLQLLLKQQSLLQKENQQLKDELAGAKKQGVQHQEGMDQLKQQVDILKFSNGEMSAEEKKQFEKRINTYLKEIDRCIAMLSE